jgi:hypothetical protein
MAPESVIVREEHLLKLAPFCQALGQAFGGRGLVPEQTLGIWRAALTAECTQCGIPLSGEELFALSQPPEKTPVAKVRRLRLGDCARPGCESYFYRLHFRPHPPTDWAELIALAETMQAESARPAPRKLALAEFARGLVRCGLTRRAALALGVLLLLLLIHRWHTGGRIPLLREPEHFHVTPAPEKSHPAD